jgi:DNA repair protein RadB
MSKVIKVERDFDILLGGGLAPKNVVHIYGAPGSGKTNFALLATAAAASEGKVIYLDSEGGFSPERLEQIVGKQRFMEVLKNVILVEPSDFDEQKVAIKKLEDIVSGSQVSLIIVDSISVLYRLEEARDMKELGRQLASLLRLARKYEVPVLIVNQVYTDIDAGRIAPIGGDLSRYWSKIMIEFERDEATGIRSAVIRKHKFLPEGIRMRFRIVNGGIQSYGIEYPANNTARAQESETR